MTHPCVDRTSERTSLRLSCAKLSLNSNTRSRRYREAAWRKQREIEHFIRLAAELDFNWVLVTLRGSIDRHPRSSSHRARATFRRLPASPTLFPFHIFFLTATVKLLWSGGNDARRLAFSNIELSRRLTRAIGKGSNYARRILRTHTRARVAYTVMICELDAPRILLPRKLLT